MQITSCINVFLILPQSHHCRSMELGLGALQDTWDYHHAYAMPPKCACSHTHSPKSPRIQSLLQVSDSRLMPLPRPHMQQTARLKIYLKYIVYIYFKLYEYFYTPHILGPIGNGLCKLPCSCNATSLLKRNCASTGPVELQSTAFRQLGLLRDSVDVETSSNPPWIEVWMYGILMIYWFSYYNICKT